MHNIFRCEEAFRGYVWIAPFWRPNSEHAENIIRMHLYIYSTDGLDF